MQNLNQYLRELSPEVTSSDDSGLAALAQRLNIYRKMRECPVIRFCFFLVTVGIRRARILYHHPDREIQDFVQRNLQILRRNLTHDILVGFEFGYAPFEKRYQVIDNRLFYKEFLPLKPWHCTIHSDRGSFKGIRYYAEPFGSGWEEWSKFVDIKPQKAFVFTHNFRFRDFYGESFYEPAVIPWKMWNRVVKLHAHAIEDFALPAIEARAPDMMMSIDLGGGKTDQTTARDLMMRVIESIRSRSAYVLPPDQDFKVEFKRAAIKDWDYTKDYDLCERLMTYALLTPRDLFREGGGSYAKAYVQSHWFASIVDALAQEIIDFLFPFVVVPIIRMNFPKYQDPARDDFGRLTYESLSIKDVDFLQKLALALIKEGRSGLPDASEIFARLHVPLLPRDSKMSLELPLTKSSLQEALRREFFAEVGKTRTELGFEEHLSIPPSALEQTKEIAAKTMRLLEEATDREAVLQDALKRVRSLARFVTYGLLGKKLWEIPQDDSRADKGAAREIRTFKDA